MGKGSQKETADASFPFCVVSAIMKADDPNHRRRRRDSNIYEGSPFRQKGDEKTANSQGLFLNFVLYNFLNLCYNFKKTIG